MVLIFLPIKFITPDASTPDMNRCIQICSSCDRNLSVRMDTTNNTWTDWKVIL